jgi:TRAP-type mannitol/chloroaromatic compound transport system permease small subunit
MDRLLKLSAGIDRLLTVLGSTGSWAAIVLMLVVCYDVVSRHYGVSKPFGLNSTQIQESEYWLHTVLFALVIGYAYLRQAHVRIDLIRGRLPIKAQYVIEMTGCLLFLIPSALVIAWLSIGYTMFSYNTGEVSKSVIGHFERLDSQGLHAGHVRPHGARRHLPVHQVARRLPGPPAAAPRG